MCTCKPFACNLTVKRAASQIALVVADAEAYDRDSRTTFSGGRLVLDMDRQTDVAPPKQWTSRRYQRSSSIPESLKPGQGKGNKVRGQILGNKYNCQVL